MNMFSIVSMLSEIEKKYLYDIVQIIDIQEDECIDIFNNNINNYNFMKQHLVECIEYFDTASFFKKGSRVETLRLALIQYATSNNDLDTANAQQGILEKDSSKHFIRLYDELKASHFDIRKNYEKDFVVKL